MDDDYDDNLFTSVVFNLWGINIDRVNGHRAILTMLPIGPTIFRCRGQILRNPHFMAECCESDLFFTRMSIWCRYTIKIWTDKVLKFISTCSSDIVRAEFWWRYSYFAQFTVIGRVYLKFKRSLSKKKKKKCICFGWFKSINIVVGITNISNVSAWT